MERHPVPQNIMDVEFKLFGALTIKQFGYAAAGFVCALLFYFSGLPDLLKWIFIAISCAAGLFLSLAKINGQSATIWVMNFIVSMLIPQERLWRKSAIVPDVLRDDPTTNKKQNDDISNLVGNDKIAAMPVMPLMATEVTEEEKKLDKTESENLQQIDEHFNFLFNELPQVPTASVNPQVKAMEPPRSPVVIKPKTIAAAVNSQNTVQETIYQGKDYAVTFTPLQNQVNRPLTLSLKTGFNPEAANYIKGGITDNAGKAVTTATVYISDNKGQVLRTASSAADGTFSVASGLPAGDYLVDVRRDGLRFPRYSISLKGDKVMEIKLQSL